MLCYFFSLAVFQLGPLGALSLGSCILWHALSFSFVGPSPTFWCYMSKLIFCTAARS